MKKKAASKTTDIEEVEKTLLAVSAKRQFIGATATLGWRLAVTVVIPIVAGVKLDERYGTAPSWTLLGLFLAAGAGAAAVWSTIREVNAVQAEEEKARKRKNKSA